MRASSAAAGKQEIPTLEEQKLYLNLCILGIAGTNLRSEGIELGRTTFRRSNNKALEYVLYRLYSIIEGKNRAQKDLKGMLPVLDKVQQAPFYQRIGDWMMELKKSGRLEPSVILPVSALKTNTSNRLVLLLLELSTIALQHDLEASAPGTVQSLYLPTTNGGSNGSGLLEDTFLPGDVRLAVGVTRAKHACSDFLSLSASESHAFDSMAQLVQTLKRKYYELHAEKRRQDAVLAEASEDVVMSTGAESPLSGPSSPVSSSASVRASSAAQFGGSSAAKSLTSPPSAGAASEHSGQLQQQHSQQSRRTTRSRAQDGQAAVANLLQYLSSLDDYLRIHVELSKALMTDGAEGGSSSSNSSDMGGGSSAGSNATGEDAMFGFSRPLQPQQQVLHPHQIDGAKLAEASAAAAASAAAKQSGRGGVVGDNAQRRPPKHMLTPFAPENLVGAVLSFSSLLSSLAPHVVQLAMAGENAGPPPLLQPPSQPSSHAAHMVHQLQVHDTACKQIAQLSRKFQERAVACEPVLEALRVANLRAQAARCDATGFGAQSHDEYPGLEASHSLPLPDPLGAPARAADPSSCLDSAGPPASATYAGMAASGAWRGAFHSTDGSLLSPPLARVPSGAGAGIPNSGGAIGTTSMAAAAAAAAMTTAAPADSGSQTELDLARLQERMRNIRMTDAAATAVQPPQAAAAPSLAVPMSPTPAQTQSHGTGNAGSNAAAAPGEQMSHEALMARLRNAIATSPVPPGRGDRRLSREGENPAAAAPTPAWPPAVLQPVPAHTAAATTETTSASSQQLQSWPVLQQKPLPDTSAHSASSQGWLLQHMLEPQPSSPSARRALDVQLSRQSASTGGSAAAQWPGTQPALSSPRADLGGGATFGATAASAYTTAAAHPHSSLTSVDATASGQLPDTRCLFGASGDATTRGDDGHSRFHSFADVTGDPVMDGAGRSTGFHAPSGLAAGVPQFSQSTFPGTGNALAQAAFGIAHGGGHHGDPEDADGDADFGLLAAEGALVSQALMYGSGTTPTSSSPTGAGVEPFATTAAGGNCVESFAAGGAGSAWGSFCGSTMEATQPVVSATAAVAEPAFGAARSDSGQGFGQGHGFGHSNSDDAMDVDDPSEWGVKSTGARSSLGMGTAGHINAALVADFGAVVVPQAQPQGSRTPRESLGASMAVSSGSFGADLLALKARMQAITGQSHGS